MISTGDHPKRQPTKLHRNARAGQDPPPHQRKTWTVQIFACPSRAHPSAASERDPEKFMKRLTRANNLWVLFPNTLQWNLAAGSTQAAAQYQLSTGRTRKSEVIHVRQTTFYPDDAEFGCTAPLPVLSVWTSY